MDFIISEDIKRDISKLPNSTKKSFLSLILEFKKANSLDEINHETVLGLPHKKYIQIEDFLVTFSQDREIIKIEYIVSKSELLTKYF